VRYIPCKRITAFFNGSGTRPWDYAATMSAECLLLTRDLEFLRLIRSSLVTYDVELLIRNQAESAAELFLRRHLDGFIIDCESVPGAVESIRQIRQSRSNGSAIVLTIVDSRGPADQNDDLGTDFVIRKPVQESELRGVLQIFLPRMEREHRKCLRFEANLPLVLDHKGRTFSARLVNVSEGGMAISSFGISIPEGIVTVRLELPDLDGTTFAARAEVVWSDKFAAGLHFIYVEPNSRAAFQSWLESLAASQPLYSKRAFFSS
jgi:CheY-like chemotaxis protein